MTRFWCECAWLGGADVAPRVLIEVDGDRVASIEVGVEPPAGAQRLRGVVIPGLANAHSHAFQRALRGRTHGARGSFWSWRDQMYALVDALDPDLMLALARATFAEMALAGVTVVGEFHYVHHGPGGVPYEDPNAMGAAVLQAAADAGIRVTLLDACYLFGGPGVAATGAQVRFRDEDADAWAQRVAGLVERPGVRIGSAIHSMRAVDPEAAGVVAVWAADRSAPLHAHVSEQPGENDQCLEAYGDSPTTVLADAGALSARFTAVHATHVTERDRALLGAARACCCLCPTTERDLADGIGPARGLRDSGARLAVGSDSQAVIDLFEEVRAVELDERLATGVRAQHAADELLDAATAGGYASLGWDDGGVLRAGALADFVAVRTDGVRLAGAPEEQLVDALVFSAAAADVGDVVVGGRVVVRDGCHVSIDVPRELAAAIKEVGL